EGRVIAVREDIFGEDAAESSRGVLSYVDDFRWRSARLRGDDFDYFGARCFEGKHRYDSLQPGSELGSAGNDGRVALRARGNHADFHLKLVGDETEVIARLLGQILHVANSRSRLLPARQGLVVGLDLRQGFDVRRHFFQGLAFVAVAGANLNLGLVVENVEFGHHHRIDAAEHHRVPKNDEVEPAATARPSCDGAKFVAARADLLRIEIGHFGREGPAANARGVRLRDADNAGDASGSDAKAGGDAAGGGVRGGDVGIGAVVDVEHRSLRALEQNGFALVERIIQQNGGVRDEPAQMRGDFEILLEQTRSFQRVAVGGGADRVFLGNHALELLAEPFGLEQIAHANAAPGHFVFVG